MPRLRIAVFHDLPSGGAKRSLRQQVSQLVARGHTVDVFVPSTADESFLPLGEVASRMEVFQRPPPPDREKALSSRLPLATGLRWLGYLKRVRESERSIARTIDAGGYDVVLVQANQYTQAPWVLRFLRTPTVYYCQEALRAAYEPRIAPTATRLLIRATLGGIDRRNARAATTLLVNSAFTRGRVGPVYHRDVEVNYLGVDPELFRPIGEEIGDFVLTVAALHPLKGIDFLIRAIGTIDGHNRPPLIVVSDRSRSAERARLEREALRLGVDLRFLFRVTESELVATYGRARLVAYTPYNEPFGFVPLEAMACGRPVLGVREGGIPETIVEGETGFLEVRDAAAFGSRIHDLLANRETAERVASHARTIVLERWSWERSVALLERHCAAAALIGRRACR
jgi:glycosyltransferase involved in cell wall biosynthesis